MDIKDFIFENCLKDDVEIASKADAIDMLIELHEAAGNLVDKNEFKNEVIKRDGKPSTALEGGIALPHAKSRAVKRASVTGIKLKAPIKWDGKKVSKIYMIASPDDETHIKILSALASALQNGEDNV